MARKNKINHPYEKITFFLLGSVYVLLVFIASFYLGVKHESLSFASTVDMASMMGLVDTSSCPIADTVYSQVSAGTLTKAQGDAQLHAECPQLFANDPLAGKTTTTTPTTTSPSSTSKFTLPTNTSTPTTTIPKKKSSYLDRLKALEAEEDISVEEIQPKSRFSAPLDTSTDQKVKELQEKLKKLEAEKETKNVEGEEEDDEKTVLRKKIEDLEKKLQGKEKPIDKELKRSSEEEEELEDTLPPVSPKFIRNIDKLEVQLESCASFVKDKSKFKKCAAKVHKLIASLCKDAVLKGETTCQAKTLKKFKKLAPKKTIEFFSAFLEVAEATVEEREEISR